MLPDQVIQQLTAFVDGELDPRQREAVTRLLNQSAEARDLVRQLQENAHRLKQLPRRKVEPSLVDEIVQAIAAQKMQPRQPAFRRAPRRRWMPYVAASLAASVLIGAIGMLYWNNMVGHDSRKGQIAINPPVENPKPAPKTLPKVAPKPTPPIPTPPVPNPEPEPTPASPPQPKTPNPLLAQLVEGTVIGFGAPIPVDPVFTTKFADLQRDDAKASQLSRELNKDRVMQFDITVKNNPKAFDHLRTVLAERGIKLVTDPNAAVALKDKNQAKVEYLVYAENVTSDEMTKLMRELSQAMVVPSTSGKNEKKEPSTYQKMSVAPAARDDKQQLAKLLGVELSEIEPKGLTEVKPDPKIVRQALVLRTSSTGFPSSEARQFIEQRRGPQAGTLRVLIKIHQE
jgi:hypothetical protein